MPQTPIYGLEYERVRGETPGRTLHGSDGSPILAEQVEAELQRIDTDVADLQSSVTSVQAGLAASRWRHIGSGTETGPAFDIVVPPGFIELRLVLIGDLDGSGTVRMRINGDSTAGLHRTSFISRRAADGAVVDAVRTDATAWYLANWGTVSGNTVEVTIQTLGVAGAPSYRSFGERMSGNDGGSIESRCWGQLTSARVVSSLNIRPFSNASNQFATCHWRLEGYLG